MDLYLESDDGKFVLVTNICGAEPGLIMPGDTTFSPRRPCRLQANHEGRHESWIERKVFDRVLWERPTLEMLYGPSSRRLVISTVEAS